MQDYCLEEKLPPLTILVINKAQGAPGDGFIAWDADDLETGLAKVYAFNWNVMDNPFSYSADGSTEDDIVEELIGAPDKAGEIFARVKVRGTAQMIFRSALLRIYDRGCAFCGLTFDDALDAAHIIPWADSSAQQRMDPNNGILLCTVHHRLFDVGLMTLSKGMVLYADPSGNEGEYSASDKEVSVARHGKAALLPKLARHRPDVDALTVHHKQHGWDV